MLKLDRLPGQRSLLFSGAIALATLGAPQGNSIPVPSQTPPTRPRITIPPSQTQPQRPKITIPTQPAPVPEFAFSPRRPRLVVLLHGVTPKPEEDRPAGVGTSVHPRFYWGPWLIQALTGFPYEEKIKYVQPIMGGALTIRTISRDDWRETANIFSNQNHLAPIVVRTPLPTENIANNTKEIELQLKMYTRPSAEPPTHVMVNFRNGSLHLMPQVGATIDQVFESYQAAYGKLAADAQPQIYLVGHSFGGNVARAICANPTAGDLWGNKLTPVQRQRADFLRARTVFVFTLSSPHEGTFIGDPAGDAAALVRKAGGIAAVIGSKIDAFTSIEPLKSLNVDTRFTTHVRDFVRDALAAVSGERDCLQDLLRVPEYNRGILHPNTAKRPNNSVIPIYTAGGRSPGGLYFDRTRGTFIPNLRYIPNSVIDVFSSGRRGKESGLLYVINSLLHREGYGYEGRKPWGSAKNAQLDIVTSPFRGIGPAQPRPLSAGLLLSTGRIAEVIYDTLRANPYGYGADGENDNDGFLSVESAHGYNLQGGAWYRLYNRALYGDWLPWDLDNHGSLMFTVGNGLYIHNLMREAGPLPAAGRISLWPGQSPTPPKKHTLSVQITEISDPDNDMDIATQADFTVYVRIGYQLFTKHATDDSKLVKNVATFTRNDLLQTVVPICISVMERDTPDPDDYCTITSFNGRDNVYVFYDTRTKQIWGEEVWGVSGQEFTTKGRAGKANNVNIKFKITGA